MPAEWEPHDATWIAWPHEVSDWPEKFETIDWVYAEITRLIAESERVEIISRDAHQKNRIIKCLNLNGVDPASYNIHLLPTDRSWLRDSAPTAVINNSKQSIEWIKWEFNAWAKYENYSQDKHVPQLVSEVSGMELVQALRPDNQKPLCLEGGAIDSDGQGTLLVTQECLLSDIQQRNPGLGKEDYEKAFADYLGIKKTIWLKAGCEGDDTHGHIDDIARFVSPGKVLLAFEENPADYNHSISLENMEILRSYKDASGRDLEVTKLPMPRKMYFGEDLMPASYANFYITNKSVLVPLFNDEKDLPALKTIKSCFPERKVIGVGCVDLVLGFGTLHCLSQQQPKLKLPDL
mgnify:CR=1 FL=1